MPSGSKVKSVGVYSRGQDGDWAFDTSLRGLVRVAAVSAGVSIGVSGTIAVTGTVMIRPINVTAACTAYTTSTSGSYTIVAAQGSGTSTEIRGFSLYNDGSAKVKIQLRFGATPFWYGGLGSEGPFNWNYVQAYPKSATNKAVKIYLASAGTVVCTVYWKKV